MKTTDSIYSLFKIIRHFPEKENEEFYSSNFKIDKSNLPSHIVSKNPKFLGPQIIQLLSIKMYIAYPAF